MMLYNWSMFGEFLGILFVNVMVIFIVFLLFVLRLYFVIGFCSCFGRNNIILLKVCIWLMRLFWFFRRVMCSCLDIILGLKLMLYWYILKFVLVINLKWFVINWIFFLVFFFLLIMCVGFVGSLFGMFFEWCVGFCFVDLVVFIGGFCFCWIFIVFMVLVGGIIGFCCCWGVGVVVWVGGGFFDCLCFIGVICLGVFCCVFFLGFCVVLLLVFFCFWLWFLFLVCFVIVV